VVLVEPEIPQNTGSVARLCAATAIPLHLVGRLGFSLEDRYLKRAGLDYWPLVDLYVHATWNDFVRSISSKGDPRSPSSTACGPTRLVGFSSHGTEPYTRVRYQTADCLVFGGESRGLPDGLRADLAPLCRIPMAEPRVRSLNLSNAVAIVVYEALRQLEG
jgi:tRNA (cytidine/uridine-2'-O-)-methyltransferase